METDEKIAVHGALVRLFSIARRDTGQSRRVADFLLAWHNAAENGGWDPTDFWNMDQQIVADILTVLEYIRWNHHYPDTLGFKFPIGQVWDMWRKPKREEGR